MRNIVLNIAGSGIRYVEGQSIGVIVPGLNADGGRHRARLYSIASSRMGDDGLSQTITLCVKRVVYKNDHGVMQKGLASNFLCDLYEGDSVEIIGPAGRTFLLPADDTVNLILIAAGTGIAPFRGFIKHIYKEKKFWNGRVQLFYGVRNHLENIYHNRQNDDIGLYLDQGTFEAFQAFSRPDARTPGQHVQEIVADHGMEIWKTLREGHFSLYICGMKGMEEGVEQVFKQQAESAGEDWSALKNKFRAEGRWNLETY